MGRAFTMRLDQMDASEKDRIDGIYKRLSDKDLDCLDSLFRSDRVHNEAWEEKVVLPSFSMENIFSTLPFTPSLYACICPACITESNFDAFSEFVSRGLLIPVFQAPYNLYPDEVISFSSKYDHISVYEYQAFRYFNMPSEAAMNLCSCCSAKMFDNMFASINSKRNRDAYLRSIDVIQGNAYPFLKFDRFLIESAQSACANNKLSQVKRLSNLSWAVNNIKTSIAFNSPLMIDPADINHIPSEICNKVDTAKSLMHELRSETAKSLGLLFSPQIPIGAYAELMQDYRPLICNLVRDVTSNIENPSYENLFRSVANLNREVVSIKNSTRYAFYKASLSFAANNANLITAAALGTILSPLSSWLGCGAAGALTIKHLKNKNFSKKPSHDPATDRLKKAIVRDAQPYTDSLLNFYFRSNTQAIRIISIQEKISDAERAYAA